MGVNSDPVTLHKYLYANADPVTYTDPTGNFSLGQLGAAMNIVGKLSTISNAIHIGSTAVDVATGEAELDNTDIALLLLENMVSRTAFRFLSRIVGKGRCNSFAVGTVVQTIDGEVAIEKLSIGDIVWSYNEESGQAEPNEITHLIENTAQYDIYSITLVGGETIEATDKHPFFLNGNWVEAKELKVGDVLLRKEGKVAIKATNRLLNVFNLTVNKNHNYYVGKSSTLVHNCPRGGNTVFRPPGSMAADQGLKVLARKVRGQHGLNRGELGRRFHRLKAQGETPGAAQSNSVNPTTGDVFDGNGNYIGNLLDDYF